MLQYYSLTPNPKSYEKTKKMFFQMAKKQKAILCTTSPVTNETLTAVFNIGLVSRQIEYMSTGAGQFGLSCAEMG